MKKIIKKLSIVAFIFLVLPLHANASNNSDNIAVFQNRDIEMYAGPVAVGSKWVTIRRKNTGFNCNLELIPTYTNFKYADIRMLDKKGRVLWQEDESIPWRGSKIYWCGADVCVVQARYSNGGFGSIEALQK